MTLAAGDWLVVGGAGALWLGVQIAVVGGLPRQLRRGVLPTAPRGTPQAFGLFWLDQYSWIGIALAAGGLALAGAGLATR